ncbi:MAG: HupE/UreJ family protein [Verrucomicrobiota bacterium]|nr:HupE/UreJ family protein [Verrucomicrobiota bacterium]
MRHLNLNNLFLRAATWTAAVIGASSAFAHDPGLSSANVELGNERINVVLTFNQRDIANITAQAQELLDRAVLVQLDAVTVTPSHAHASTDANNNVEFQFTFPRAAIAPTLTFRSPLLKDLPFGHRQVFTVRDGNGRELSRLLLSAREDSARLALQASDSSPPSREGFLEFLLLGIRHILTGYDHLLFLFGLLVMCQTGRTAALLITCFTAAHSLTLALSTFGLVNLPSRFVEAAIAASILYVGVENIFRGAKPMRGRALLTFAFGLIHGLGFASVLREMGVANSGSAAIIPLVAFNSGVELGQLSVAAIILPVAWFLRRNDSFRRVGVPALSLAVALAGGYWLLDRTVF